MRLENLAEAWMQAKEAERAAIERRRDIEDQLRALANIRDDAEGVQALDCGAWRMKITCRLDRKGKRIALELAIKRQCRDTAVLYGLRDRGLLQPGMLADVNVIDMDKIKLGKPWLAFDLPAGGKRLLQKADGYVATIKSGQITFRDGVMQGPTPGIVLRGPQAEPMALAAE